MYATLQSAVLTCIASTENHNNWSRVNQYEIAYIQKNFFSKKLNEHSTKSLKLAKNDSKINAFRNSIMNKKFFVELAHAKLKVFPAYRISSKMSACPYQKRSVKKFKGELAALKYIGRHWLTLRSQL